MHRRDPFEWQSALADTVCNKGWPDYLDMPTASGKTSVIDIAVFHLALEGRKGGRRAPLRIAFVVDRRLVVDGALEHARCVADRLAKPEKEVTCIVAESLASFSGGEGRPLETVKLRGGIPQEGDWARTPSQPTVIVSTVDQVGSRLLFRGYGVSDSMKPVHAGLLGADTLLLLDEAHTSRPFLDTLEQIAKMRERQKWAGGLPFACMFMSATLSGADAPNTFPARGEAVRLLRGDGAMRKRLGAHKRARLVEAPNGGGAEEIVKAALDLARPKNPAPGTDPPRRIGIVVNRVDAARSIYDALCKRGGGARAHLLTGRARQLERDLYVKAEIDRLKPGGERCPCDRREQGGGSAAPEAGERAPSGKAPDGDDDETTFFVATQCIEVGVDADFDALVTQIAPLDSLRQRFGRLDRIGSRGDSDAVIVATREETSKKYKDPVYGDRIPKAWKYLKDASQGHGENGRKGIVDFGVEHFPMRDGWDAATAPRTRPVTLMPSYVELWYQTKPRPVPDPDPGVFLHGPGSKSADVQVVWRADVTDDAMASKLDLAKAGLLTCRPSALEAVSLPIWVARRWLAGGMRRGDGDNLMSDLEGVDNAKGADGGDGGGRGRPCAIRWKGARSAGTRAVTADEVQPGDTLVVPAERGGCDMYGWNEARKDPVRDIGMDANLFNRRVFTMRLGKQYLSHMRGDDADMAGHGDGKAAPGLHPPQAFRGDAKEGVERVARELADESPDVILGEIAGIDGIPEAWAAAIEIARGGGHPASRHVHLQKASAEGDRTVIAGIQIDLDREQASALIRKMYPGNGNALAMAGAEGAHLPSSTDDREDGGGGRGSGASGTVPTLSEHCKGVEGLVKKFAEDICMDEELRNDLALAARLHDAGKAEKRVQAFLRRLDPDDLPEDAEPVAKSERDLSGPDEYYGYLEMARLPRGYRHECWSVRLAEGHPDFKNAHDANLVRYVIGTHHGYGRPLFPPVDDRRAQGKVELSLDGARMTADVQHGLADLGSGWIDMCDSLYQRYGPWQLAHMEAIIRLADHRQSGEERDGA